MMEEVLVEKLAVLEWRYRRLLAAAAAEVDRSTEFLEEDRDHHIKFNSPFARQFSSCL
jgi:hypothetical protein